MRSSRKNGDEMLEKIEDAISERILDITHSALASPCQDYAGYREIVGRVAGLREALEIIHSLHREED